MKVKGFLKDISGIIRLIKKRNDEIKNANGKEIPEDKITSLARELHPGIIKATVKSIKRETKDSKRIVFASERIPFFKAGTYLTIFLEIGHSYTSRSYSIVSSPLSSYKNKEVEIIVKDYKDGFVSKYLNNELKENDEVEIEVGQGQFYYDEYRDEKNITAIAGGVGITPFIALAKDIKERSLDINLTILYGSEDPKNIIGKKELDSLAEDNIRVVYVISGNYNYDGEKGFIDKRIIEKYSLKDCSYFFCGPKVMFDKVSNYLRELDYDLRRFRYESFPIADITKEPDFDMRYVDDIVNIEVHRGLEIFNIKTVTTESIAVALERSGLRIKTSCRNGSCGVCRIKILEGKYYVPASADKRRYTDKEFDYVHACSTYPLGNLKIKIPIF